MIVLGNIEQNLRRSPVYLNSKEDARLIARYLVEDNFEDYVWYDPRNRNKKIIIESIWKNVVNDLPITPIEEIEELYDETAESIISHSNNISLELKKKGKDHKYQKYGVGEVHELLKMANLELSREQLKLIIIMLAGRSYSLDDLKVSELLFIFSGEGKTDYFGRLKAGEKLSHFRTRNKRSTNITSRQDTETSIKRDVTPKNSQDRPLQYSITPLRDSEYDEEDKSQLENQIISEEPEDEGVSQKSNKEGTKHSIQMVEKKPFFKMNSESGKLSGPLTTENDNENGQETSQNISIKDGVNKEEHNPFKDQEEENPFKKEKQTNPFTIVMTKVDNFNDEIGKKQIEEDEKQKMDYEEVERKKEALMKKTFKTMAKNMKFSIGFGAEKKPEIKKPLEKQNENDQKQVSNEGDGNQKENLEDYINNCLNEESPNKINQPKKLKEGFSEALQNKKVEGEDKSKEKPKSDMPMIMINEVGFNNKNTVEKIEEENQIKIELKKKTPQIPVVKKIQHKMNQQEGVNTNKNDSELDFEDSPRKESSSNKVGEEVPDSFFDENPKVGNKNAQNNSVDPFSDSNAFEDSNTGKEMEGFEFGSKKEEEGRSDSMFWDEGKAKQTNNNKFDDMDLEDDDNDDSSNKFERGGDSSSEF